nr:InlB B-repeat-containing protein [Acholeplasma laidlawii]
MRGFRRIFLSITLLLALITLVGCTGIDGNNGNDGLPGIDGVSITQVIINDQDELIITFSDGTTSNLGVVRGEDGTNGSNGLGVSSFSLNDEGELVVTYSDNTTKNLGKIIGANGNPGADGKEVSLQVANGYIQWKYDTDETWINLIELSSLVGAKGDTGNAGSDGSDGKEVLFQVSATHIQWQYVGDSTWKDLVALSTLVGAKGEQGNPGADGKEVSLQVANGYIQWKYDTDETWINLIELSSLVGAKGDTGNAGSDGSDGKEVLFQVSATHIQWQYVGDSTWKDLVALSTLVGAKGEQGNPGADGKEVSLQVANGYIQWKYDTDETWINLIELSSLVGAKGDTGNAGSDGTDGLNGIDGREVLFQVADGFIQWQYTGDSSWTNLVELTSLVGPAGQDGVDGIDGKQVTFQVSEGFIQWQYVGDTTWTNLIDLQTITGADGSNGTDGADGREVLFQVAEGFIQWQYTGDTTWTNLVELTSLVGPAGQDGVDGINGKQVTFQVSEGFIQLQYVGDTTWTNLIDLQTITGADGSNGTDGADGREVLFQVADGFIQWQYTGDTTWTNLVELTSLVGPAGQDGVDGINGKQVTFQVSEGFIQWQYVGDTTWTNLIDLQTITGADGSKGTDGADGREVLFQVSGGYIQWQYTGDSSWINLVELTSLVGPAGQDGVDGINGKQVTFQVSEGFIQWQYVGDTTWTNLIDLQTITGADGSNGTDGADGREVLFQVAEGYIKWQYTGDSSWTNLVELTSLVGPAGQDGVDGINGKQVTFQVSEGFIQWQYVGDTTWTNLIDLQTITGADGSNGTDGADGREVLFQVADGFIQWQYTGDSSWTNLVELTSLVGPAGQDGVDGINGKQVTFQVSEGFIQWQYVGDTTWTNLIDLQTITGADGSNGTDGADGREVLFQVAEGYIQWQYTGDTTWTNLVELTTLVGPAGADGVDGINGKQVTFQVSEGFIQWQYVGDTTWTNLIDLQTITGADGSNGTDGADGREVLFQVAEGYIQWQYTGDSSWTNLVELTSLVGPAGQDGVDGINGKQVTFQVSEGFIQWQYVGDTTWTNLIDLQTITGADGSNGTDGADGREVLFQVAEGYIQWQYTGDTTWTNLIEINALTGQTGVGILSTDINQQGELIITYTNDVVVNIGRVVTGYTVNFVGMNGYLIDSQYIIYGQSALEPTAPIVTGYTFVEWDTAFNQVTSNLTVRAIYQINTYTISFNTNGGSYIAPLTGVTYGSMIELPFPTKEGYGFKGWFTGNTVNDGQFTNLSMVTSDLTLYAKWESGVFTVRFVDADDFVLKEVEVISGASTTPPVAPTIEGYTFVGWSTSYTLILKDTLIKALYEANSYTITFNSNGGSLVESITQDYATTIIQPNDPTRQGYTFGGWYGDSSLTTAYTFTTIPAQNITLYAKWNIITYGIDYELDGGDNHGSNPSSYTVETNTITLSEPSKEGYTFNGWYSDEQYTAEVIAITQGSISDITLYAKWSISSYTITFDSNGGSLVEPMAQDYATTVIQPTNPTKAGYTFGGWYSDSDLTTAYIFTSMPSGNITLYAKWNIITYGIDYDLDGGDNHVSNPSSYTVETNTITLSEPSKEGYTFNGWYSDEQYTAEVIAITQGSIGDITLYAKWSINNYTINYYNHDYDLLSTIPLIPGDQIISVSLGSGHSTALTSSGRLFTWGYNDYGQLGDGTTTKKYTPTEITSQFSLSTGDKIISVSLGEFHSAALTSSGRLFTWGSNGSGQLGDGTITNKYTPTEITSRFSLSTGDQIISVSLGGSYSAALTSSGRLFTWGNNYSGQLGDGTSTSKSTPTEITSQFNLVTKDKIIQVSLGYDHSAALTSSGRLFTWGYNRYGQLGDGTSTSKSTPTEITSQFNLVTKDKIIQVSLGYYHSAALTSSGRLFTWGYDDYGQLGNGPINRSTPTEITSQFNLVTKDKIIQVSLGYYHSAALTSSGRLFTWGLNYNGRLGDGTTINRSTPTEITSQFSLSTGDQIISVSLGSSHSAALTSSGRLFTWGYNSSGQLGDDTTTSKSTPTEITQAHYELYSDTIVYNQSIMEYVPFREGYTLDRWYSDSSLTTAYIFTSMPSSNITLYAKWNIITYGIDYELDGGDNHVSNPSSYTVETNTITLSEPSKEGYTFSGWYSDSSYVNKVTEITLGSFGNMTLYAKWSINQYTITFDSNGGSLIDVITQDYATTVTEPTSPTKEGYTFGGWYSDSSLTNAYTFTTMPAQNITLYAKWQKTITFNTNGGSTVESITQDYGTTVIQPNDPTREGYTFGGWFSDSGLAAAYTFSSMPAQNITLYAKWQNTITFNTNGGSLVEPITQDTLTTVAEPTDPSKEGYTFGGWYSDSSLTNAYTFITMPSQNITLYAKWNINSYDITFIENQGTVVNDIIDQEYGTIITYPTTSRSGYTFSGWYIDNGTFAQEFTSTTIISLDITLYAKWVLTQYNIIYDLDGGTNHSSNPEQYTIAMSDILLQSPTKEGHSFVGWYSDQELSSRVYFVSTNTLDTVTVYAKWNINQYTITFDSNGGSLVESIIQDYATTVIQPTNPTKAGYTFGGWYSDSDLTTAYIFTSMPSSNRTLYAKWNIITYGIDYELDDGDNHVSNPSSYTVETNTITLSEPSKEGYTFSGWHSDEQYTVEVLEITQGSIGDITLYAKWTINNYTVNYYIHDYYSLSTIPLIPGETIIQVSLGGSHSAALTSSGRLFTWGRNYYGQLGDGTTTDKYSPTEITSQFSLSTGDQIISVSLGQYHSTALTSSGRLFTWGYNNSGQLGNGATFNRSTPTEITSRFSLATGDRIIQVSLGYKHSAALTSSGRLFTWGYNDYGQLGDGTTFTDKYTPTEITSRFSLATGDKIIQVSLGYTHSAALTSSGRIFTWGSNGNGQLGDGTTTNRSTPTEITSRINLATGDKIIQFSLGFYYSAALTSSGRLFTWGYNIDGRLGDGTARDKYTPTEITSQFSLSTGDQIISVSLGGGHSTALTSSGRLFTWGSNADGRLGDGTTTNLSTSTEITSRFNLVTGDKIIQVSLGGSHSAALTSSGRLFTWGSNADGRLGDGTTTNLSTPAEITQAHYELLHSDTVIYNQNITEYMPIREGYTFSSWFSDTNLTIPYMFRTMPAVDVLLYGKWTINQYDITFIENQGTTVNDIMNQDYGTNIAYPTTSRTGYTFDGWYLDNETFLQPFTSTTIISSDITLYAKWNINQYTITFDSNGGSLVESLTQDYATTVIQPNDPTRQGYTFGGWYGDSSLTTAYIFTTMPAQNITLYAKWNPKIIIVNYVLNNGTDDLVTYQYADTELLIPTYEGYVFDGWYLDSDLTTEYTNTNYPTFNTSLYAKWNIITYSIDYNLDGGDKHVSNPSSYTVETNTITLGEPNKEGYTFSGWYSDSSYVNKVTEIRLGSFGNMTLYAKWSINQYTITFDSNGGSLIDVITQDYATTVTEPTSPTKEGYAFSGWYIDYTLTTPYAFGIMPAEDITLYAKWEILYSIAYNTGDFIETSVSGGHHSLALTLDGRIFAWGYNGYGQLGDGTTIDKNIPIEITNQFNLNFEEVITNITAGRFHSLALSSEGRIFSWGHNWYGELGTGTFDFYNSIPLDVSTNFELIGEEKIIEIYSGQYQSYAITSVGRIYAWGYNAYGQLGDGTTIDKNIPIEITNQFNLNFEEVITNITAGGFHSLALSSEGRIFSWGDNRYGQLGDGTSTNKYTPTEITTNITLLNGDSIVEISAGESHSMLLTSNGNVFVWGLTKKVN